MASSMGWPGGRKPSVSAALPGFGMSSFDRESGGIEKQDLIFRELNAQVRLSSRPQGLLPQVG